MDLRALDWIGWVTQWIKKSQELPIPIVDWKLWSWYTAFRTVHGKQEQSPLFLIGYALNFHSPDRQMSLPLAPDENDSSLLKSRRPSKTLTLDEE